MLAPNPTTHAAEPEQTGLTCRCGHDKALHFGDKELKTGKPRNDCFHPWGYNGVRCSCKLFKPAAEERP